MLLAALARCWKQIVEKEEVKRLKRIFKFNNFADVVIFTQKIATLAEDRNHHPTILIEWSKVIVY